MTEGGGVSRKQEERRGNRGDQVPRDNGHPQLMDLHHGPLLGTRGNRLSPSPLLAQPCAEWAFSCQEGREASRTPDSAAPSSPPLPCPTPESEQSHAPSGPAPHQGPLLLPQCPRPLPPAKWRLIVVLGAGSGFGRMGACGWTPRHWAPDPRWGELQGVLLR